MRIILGIDVSKEKFDVMLLTGDRTQHRIFDNDDCGFAALAGWLERVDDGGRPAWEEAAGG